MYRIVTKRNLLLTPNKYICPGEFIVTKHGEPIFSMVIKAVKEWPQDKIVTDEWRPARLDKGAII